MKKTIEDIAAEDSRYNAKALRFVYEGLGLAVEKIRQNDEGPEPRHISGQEFSEVLTSIAMERWGRLAKVVLNHWNINTTRDMGEIVYLLIANNLMSTQENDTIEDFDDVLDFEEVFEKRFRFEI